MSKTWGFFLVAQDMVLSHRAKFQLIINFFRVKAISTGLYITVTTTSSFTVHEIGSESFRNESIRATIKITTNEINTLRG